MPTDSEKPAGTGTKVTAAISATKSENVLAEELKLKRGGHDVRRYAQQQQEPQQQEQQQEQQQKQQQAPLKSNRHPMVDFAIAGLSTSCACVLSNPMEVVKTRMQLQGELVLRENASVGATITAAAPATAAATATATATSNNGKTGGGQGQHGYRRPYRNAFDAFYKICRDEGFRGIQAGLLPGLMYQVLMNGTRLSLFAPVQAVLGADPDTNSRTAFFFRNLAAGAACGAAGAVVGSPLYLIKARLQSQTTAHSLRTPGTGEFRYRGMWHAVTDVFQKEGPRGFTRGMSASVMRVMVGSATQLSSYSSCKAAVLGTGLFEDNVYAYLASSMVAGLVVTTAMNPFDVISTRLYTQGTGVAERYTGPLDCAVKTVRAEGVRGVSGTKASKLYKGWTPHYFRLGPHTIYTFLIWEEFKKLADRWGL